ncbi:unnamed protein product, partial [Ixodes hexagonus]
MLCKRERLVFSLYKSITLFYTSRSNHKCSLTSFNSRVYPSVAVNELFVHTCLKK